MSITRTFYRGGNFKLIGDPDANPLPKRFTVFLNGLDSVVTADEGDCALQTWAKVLDHMQQRRISDKRAGGRASHSNLATIYAGELTEDSLTHARTKHMTEFVVAGLLALVADPKVSAAAKMRAYKLMLKIQPIAVEGQE